MNWTKSKLFQNIFLLLIMIVGFNYFFATFLPEFFKYFRFLVLGLVTFFGIFFFKENNKFFSIPIKIITVTILFSILSSLITWNQSIFYSLLATIPILIWPIFFLLLKINIPIRRIENTVLFLGVLNLILFIYQYQNPSNVLFNFGMVGDEYEESRFTGIIRVVFPGAGIFWLTVYIALNRLTFSSNKFKWLYLIIVIAGIIVPAMQSLRSYVVPTVLVFLFHFARYFSFRNKILMSIIIILGSFLLFNSKSQIISGLIEKQENTVSQGTKDIRYIAAVYFLKDFSPSPINWIFGNGVGHEREEYGEFMIRLKDKGFHISDVGIIGLFALFGIIPIIIWGGVFFQIIYYKIPKKYIYVKYYFFNVLFGAFVGSTLYHVNFMISNILALYIFQKCLEDKTYLLGLLQILVNKLKLAKQEITE